MKIRPGLFYDIDTLAELQVTMAWETEEFKLDPPTVHLGVQAVIDDPSKGRYWIAEIDGEVAGCLLTVPEWSDWRNSTVLWIHSVYTWPQHRKKGVYKALYLFLKEKVQNDSAYAGLRLYVEKKNHIAQSVYSKLGMSEDHYSLYEWLK
jgi:GNAT superfamily N-acetyltransferase